MNEVGEIKIILKAFLGSNPYKQNLLGLIIDIVIPVCQDGICNALKDVGIIMPLGYEEFNA